MMVERKELERNLRRTFVGFKFNIHMTNSHVRSIISSRFELIEALYTVDYLIMHTIRPHPQPMHYEIYATQSNVTRV